jgi:uncharacterized protein YciI
MRVRRIAFALVFVISAASVAFAQQAAMGTASASAPAASPAKHLFAVEIRTGPQWNAALPPGQQPLMREHSAHLRKLRDEGRIRFGARYGEVGLVVLEAATIDEARTWMEADPSMRSGTFRFEIFPFSVFYGGAVGR